MNVLSLKKKWKLLVTYTDIIDQFKVTISPNKLQTLHQYRKLIEKIIKKVAKSFKCKNGFDQVNGNQRYRYYFCISKK